MRLSRAISALGVFFAFSILTPAYEVIFHEGFEGEQFPPLGWEYLTFERSTPGYHSGHCAYAEVVPGGNYAYLQSPYIDLIPGDEYTFRVYARAELYYYGTHGVGFQFDDGSSVSLDHPFYSYGWTKSEETVGVPETATSGYFKARGEPYSWEDWFLWYLDDFSVIHTATAVTPTSLSRVKAAYR
jgi:hypothetical protein